MRDLALDPVTGDLVISARGLRLTATGAEALAQKLRARLSLFKGEWFLDTRVGVPYYTDVFGQRSHSAVEALLRRVILTCPGVTSLERFAMTATSPRAVSITFSARSTTGEIVQIRDFIATISGIAES